MNKKTKPIGLRLTGNQYDKIEEIMTELNMDNVSDVIRMLIDNYDKEQTQYVKELQHIKNTLKDLL